jgi:hypothetical protein
MEGAACITGAGRAIIMGRVAMFGTANAGRACGIIGRACGMM